MKSERYSAGIPTNTQILNIQDSLEKEKKKGVAQQI
jgi:hypothetical protein